MQNFDSTQIFWLWVEKVDFFHQKICDTCRASATHCLVCKKLHKAIHQILVIWPLNCHEALIFDSQI